MLRQPARSGQALRHSPATGAEVAQTGGAIAAARRRSGQEQSVAAPDDPRAASLAQAPLRLQAAGARAGARTPVARRRHHVGRVAPCLLVTSPPHAVP